jgi:hypothetical protein
MVYGLLSSGKSTGFLLQIRMIDLSGCILDKLEWNWRVRDIGLSRRCFAVF